MAVRTIRLDLDAIYASWRRYLLANSSAKHFGMVFDTTKKAQFPYANLALVSRSVNGSDLEGDEATISLVFETEAYINNNKYLSAYDIDSASADFFCNLGFRRLGNTQLIRVSDTVTKVTSRFSMAHYNGDNFLTSLE